MVKPPEILMKGTPSRFGPRLGVIPSREFEGITLGTSVVPVKQNCAALPVPQDAVTRLVRCGCRKVAWASRKYVARSSFTTELLIVQVCVMLTCCARVALLLPKHGKRFGVAAWTFVNGCESNASLK